jgi:hypothetical protein
VVVSMLAGSLLAFAFVGWEQRAAFPEQVRS